MTRLLLRSYGSVTHHWKQINMVHVPCKSGGPVITDVIAGNVSVMFSPVTQAEFRKIIHNDIHQWKGAAKMAKIRIK